MESLLISLQPETGDEMKRVRVRLLPELPGISMEAEDSHSLRAALNSYLRWLDITDKIGKEFT